VRVNIAGRQVEVTKALQQFTEKKLAKLERLLDGPVEAHVVLGIEKHRHLCEMQVRSRTALLSGQSETEDLYASVGDVVDKLERQALKHKEKRKERKKKATRRAPRTEAAAAAEPVRRRKAAVEEAPSVVAPRPRIVRTRRYRLKPLTPDDALLELETTQQSILVYRDAETYRVNVIYRRPDGAFGLVDPEF
jgi:putative sigma-54 modulation protein